MKTLSQLQNEAIERFEIEFGVGYLWENTPAKQNKNLKKMKKFLKTELQTIVKESFKNTRVEESELIEKLAEIEHTRWANWQKYFFSRCQVKPQSQVDGMDDRYVYLALLKTDYERWNEQIKTEYFLLSDLEKESDRKEARISLNQALSDKHNKEQDWINN